MCKKVQTWVVNIELIEKTFNEHVNHKIDHISSPSS